MKTLFLDFDGVLFDTVLESYLLARYAFRGIEPQEKVDEKEYNIFHSARYLITNSWHYYYIFKLINDENYSDMEDFAKKYYSYINNRDEEADLKFDKLFQEKRKDLINNHFEFWNKLDKPYHFFEEIKNIAKDFNILIVSTKNEEAILRHCLDYGLNIKEENITGKTKLKSYSSKKAFLEYYINANKTENSLFIDDSKTTIEKCSDIPNLTALCANWGYVKEKKDGYNEEEILKIIKEK